MNTKKTIGYLPDEKPSFGKLILFALQQIVVMFPATVLVAILTGFHVSTTIFASGLATLSFILITKKKIPLYYGSSFSYIAAICSITGTEWVGNAPDHLISQAQFGIIMSGFVSIAVGLVVRRFSMDKIEKVLPPTITGPIAIIIGLTLAGSAMGDPVNVKDLAGVAEANLALAKNMGWLIALITLLSTILFSVYVKKGTWGQIPILLGLLVGYISALIIGWIIGINYVDFSYMKGDIISVPHFTLPRASWGALVAIMPIAIATIPESTAHLYQLDIYVNQLASEKESPKNYKIADKLGLNLIGDGLGDIISGAVGGPAGTNYGENISTMAVTKNYSIYVLMTAAIITMIIAFISPISGLVYSLPRAVIGGLSIYLFGVIATQGVTIMVEKKVNFFDAKSLAVISTILIIGIGGHFAFDNEGIIPLFGINAPAIATAAIAGILLNLLFLLLDKIFHKKKKEVMEFKPSQEEMIEE